MVSQNPQRTPIDNFRDCHAYVLLGAPGSGKTTVFKDEAESSNSYHYESARDFITYKNKPEWQNKVLFIDGLDEVRAGTVDGRIPIDNIREILYQLNCPKFRISCRATDWFGAIDRRALRNLTKGEPVKILYLNPLTDDHIIDFLCQDQRVSSADIFLKLAREYNIDYLLYNPQSLNLLVKSVANNQWPKSRFEAFDMACKKLIIEKNKEYHALKIKSKFNQNRLLDEAGKICAYLLLTGKVGFKLMGNDSTTEYIVVDQIEDVDLEVCDKIFKSRLFDIMKEGHVAPIHKNIAEFLAGKYLGKLIEQGLGVERILSLITSVDVDGGNISKFQNLFAWIASFSYSAKLEIIDRDPLGAVFYGDCLIFSSDQIKQLIEDLREQAKKNPLLFIANQSDYRLDAFATPDMVDYFQLILQNFNAGRTSKEHDVLYVAVILTIFINSRKTPKIANEFVNIFKKNDCSSLLKELALNAYIRHSDSKTNFNELEQLLNKVSSGELEDPDDSLLGLLLKRLYPSNINSSELLKYYRPRKTPNVIGYYHLFWWYYIAENSDSCQLTQIIDNFKCLVNKPVNEFNEDQLSFWKYSIRIYYELVYQFLKRYPDEVEPILQGIFGVKKEKSYAIGGKKIDIWNFLSENPNIQIKLLNLRLNYCEQYHKHDSYKDFKYCISSSINRLVSPSLQSKLIEWYLDKATTATNKYTVKFFIHKVATYTQPNHNKTGVSQEFVLNRLKYHPIIRAKYKKKYDRLEQNRNQEIECDIKELKRQNQERYNIFKHHETVLLNNVCPVSILNKLSLAYFDSDVREYTPHKRLNFLLGDDSLVEASLLGLKNSICRKDVPSIENLLRYSVSDEKHLLIYPMLAGLHILVQNLDALKIAISNENYLCRILTLVFSTQFLPQELKNYSVWLPKLLNCSPKIFTKVLTQTVSFQLNQGINPFFDLEYLVHDIHLNKPFEYENRSETSTFHQHRVAGSVSMKLLKTFPEQSNSNQLSYLVSLLRVASLHGEQNQLVQLIDNKLSGNNMNLEQRIYWLAGSFWVSGDKYLSELQNYIKCDKQHNTHLKKFLESRSWHPLLNEKLEISTIRFYITLFAPVYHPSNEIDYEVLSITDQIHLFINQLARMESSEAGLTLKELSSEENLKCWRLHFLDAIELVRESQFEYLNIDKITNTLQNKYPANSADLTALTLNLIEELDKNIRDGVTSDWRQYWNTGPHGKPIDPKNEQLCRDTFLSDLNLKFKSLNLNIEALPEVVFANDKRADIVILYKELKIPIEIKKSKSKDVFTAIKNQLPKYTRDPKTNGYCIYLIFWFGKGKTNQNVNSAEELRQRLIDTLSKNEKHKISIYVIDVAKQDK